jgi:hypothetical protein
MVCVFLWTRAEAAAGVARTNEVLVARDRDALYAHLNTLIEEEHPMAMRFEEADHHVSWVEDNPDLDYWYDKKGSEFVLQNFPNVPVSSDGRAWVVCKRWGIRNSVFTDKRPDPVEGEGEVFEVFILGTQLSKSASKT